jgi:acetoin utilization deacetylase AcuC-like enzyme
VHRLYYTDNHEFPLPAGHKFPLAKYRLLREELSRDNVWSMQPALPARLSDIERVHDPRYVRAFVEGSLDASALRRIGFPWSPELVLRTLASVGGTLAATEDARAAGWGGTLAGGTHHAFRDAGAGFCVFNDLAVASGWLRHGGHAERIAVLDLDVHQGDGTASLFTGDADVLTVSVHGRNNFPFRKQVSDVDIELDDGAGDAAFLEAAGEALWHVRRFRPDFILFQSGVDGLATDRLGRLKLTHEGLAQRDALVFEACSERGVPCAITLGGGYSEPISETVRAHAATFRLARRMLGAATREEAAR